LKKKKVLFVMLEVVALAILTIAAYFGSMWLLGITIYAFLPYLNRRWNIPIGDFSPVMCLIMILIFNALWIATIKFWPLKNIHVKIVLTLLVFAFSAAFVTGLIGQYLLRDFKW